MTAQWGGRPVGKGTKGSGAGHDNAGKSVKSPGGEAHAQLRCLRRRTGTAYSRSPHRLHEKPVPHRLRGLLPPSHHQSRRGRTPHDRGQGRRRSGTVFVHTLECLCGRILSTRRTASPHRCGVFDRPAVAPHTDDRVARGVSPNSQDNCERIVRPIETRMVVMQFGKIVVWTDGFALSRSGNNGYQIV